MPSSDSRISSDQSRSRAVGSLALVCLPALLLAAFGFLYVRHEIAIAEREVREEARLVATRITDALNRSWSEFLQTGTAQMRRIGPELGDLTSLSELTPASDESRRRASEKYRQALDLIAEGETEAAENLLWELIDDDNSRWTESGLRLRPLAFYQLAKLNPEFFEGNLSMAVVSAIRTDPSPLSETLLVRACALAEERGCADDFNFDMWWKEWKATARSREILAPFLRDISPRPVSRDTWIEHEGIRHHLVISPDGKFLPISLAEIERLAGEVVVPILNEAPTSGHRLIFAVTYRREAIWPARFNQESVREGWHEIYGSDPSRSDPAASLADVAGSGPFGVRAELADPESFQSAIRRKMLWLGSFLTLAVGCTGLGAWRTWRAIEKQSELNRQQSDFISSVSHELRAPVASIRLLGELLASGKAAKADDEKRGEYAQLIERESGRLSALVDNVLDLSRIGRGTKEYRFEPTAIAALVRDSVERMEPLAAEQGVEISVEINPPVDDPEVDPVAIQQAMTNLLDNAIKFSPRDSTIEVFLKSKEAGKFEIAVRDEGPGISEGEQERIFERFYRIGSELRRETEGIGIGLSLVRHIMEAHCGRVEVDSAPGEGSTFTLVFPDP